MDKTLTVVVPHWKEAANEAAPLFSSLNGQIGVDFREVEVLLINDGGGAPLGAQFLSAFGNLDARALGMGENGGPGLARQAGIDAAAGEYVAFCDADDVLHNVGALGAMLEAAKSPAKPDIITSPWLEEIKAGNGWRYMTHEDEATWMHGKAIRRAFLDTRGIRFHPDLRVHEDSYFLGVAYALTDRVAKIPALTYVWRWRDGSITRRDNAAYTFNSIPAYIKANMLAAGELEGKNPDALPRKAAQFALYMFFSLHRAEWLAPGAAPHLKAAEASMGRYLARFGRWLEACPKEVFAEICMGERARTFAGNVETELFEAWARRLGGD
jgi:glycosyltransferase involved in cell wall biosynthesis